jgi:hypothetical protein
MGQRDRLLGRRIPPTPVAIRVVFTAEADAAQRSLDAAEEALRAAAGPVATADAQARVDAARAAMAPFVEVLEVAAIPPSEFDALVSAHPPSDELREKQQAAWDPLTFPPALLAACIGRDLPEAERMSEKDWAEFMTSAAAASGEMGLLFATCMTVNDRSPDVQVGKGYGGTPS